jgi:hypothetical protein
MENLATFKTTPSMYQHVVQESQSSAAQRAFDAAAKASYDSPAGFTLTRKGGTYKVISVRTSDSDLGSYSSSVSHVAYLAPQGTGSFVQMHNDISTGIANTLLSLSVSQANSSARGGRPTTPSTGELEPVGGAVLPMLLLACAYMVVRFFKNRKISKQVNSQTL